LRMSEQVIAEFSTWAGMVETFRLRVEQLQTTYEAVCPDLADRYVAKLLAPIPVKAVGQQSFDAMTRAMGMRFIAIPDETAAAALAERITPRKPGPHRARDGMPAKWKQTRRGNPLRNPAAARLLQARWMLKTTPRQRAAWSRKAALARWKRKRSGERNRSPEKRTAADGVVHAAQP
jgi:hypothetical protein